MKAHFSLTRRDLNVFIACLLSFSILMMPFVSIAASSSGSERRVSSDKSSEAGAVATNAPLPAPVPAPLVATISATKSGAILNDDGDSKADPTNGNPGTTEKIEYTVTVSNTGNTDATNVIFTDTIDAHTTLVDGSITTQPIAVNDTYSSIGNVGIDVPDGGTDLLGNDCDPDPLGGPCTNTGLTISVLAGDNSLPFAGTSAQGGNVTATVADGSFKYSPAPGFEGSDSFTYTTVDGTGKTDTATVTITVAGMIWFVQAGAAAGGDGRLLTPFNCLVGAGCFQPTATADEPGDFIFVFSGTYNDNAALALLNNQKLIGAAITIPLAGPGSVTNFTIPAHSNTLPNHNQPSPVINSTASGIQLASGNLLRGFTVGNTSTAAANYDILNTGSVGSLTVLEVILNGTGGLFRADAGGILSVSFASAATSSAGSNGIHLVGTSGSVAIAGSGLITGVAGSDVLISGGTVSFTSSGSITHAAGANPMVNITGGHSGGAVTFTGTLNASSGTGLVFDNADSTYNFNASTTTLAGGDAGIDILNGSAGTFNFGGTVITNPSGVALNVSASSGAISISGAISKNTDGKMIDFDNYDSGTATISGTLSCTSICDGVEVTNDGLVSGTVIFSGATKTLNTGASVAVNLDNNDGGNVNFTGGGLDIDTTSGNGFSATNGGTITVTGTGNSIVANGSGTALNVVTTTIGADNLNFQLISAGTGAGSAGAGIILDDTGASGGLVVTGNGGTCTAADQTGCTGGIIQRKTGANITDTGLPAAISGTTGTGIFMRSTRNVSLTRMHIHDFDNYAIFGSSVINFTLANSVVNGVNGNDPNVHEAAMAFQNLTGSASVSSTVIQGGVNDNVRVVNNTGTLDRIVFQNFTEGPMDLGNTNGNDGMLIQAQGNSTIKMSVLDSSLTSARGDILQFDLAGSAAGNPTGDLIFRRNTVNNTHPFVVVGGGGLTLSGGGFASSAPTLTYDIGGGAGNGNTFRGARGTALLILFQTGAGSATGRIENNTFGVTGVSGSCSTEANCIEIRTEGRAAQTSLVNNNTIQQYAGVAGVYYEMDGINTAGSTGTIGALNSTVTNNTVREPVGPPSGTSSGIHYNFGATAGDTYNGCADILNNTANNAGENDASSAGRDYIVRQRNSTTLRLPGYVGGATDTAAVTAYIQGRNINGASSSVFVQANITAPGQGILNTSPAGSACTQPPAAVIAGPETSASAGQAAGEGKTVAMKPSIPTATTRHEGPSLLARATNAFVQFARDVQSMVEPTASAAEITTTSTPKAAAVANASNGTLRATASKAKSVQSHHPVLKRQPGQAAKTEVKNSAAASSLAPAMAGETVTINIGTLRPGDSVTITFQVTVNNPPNLTGVPPGPAQVSNFGEVDFNDGATPLSTNTNTVNTPVDLFNTTTALVSDLNPSNFGDLVTFTATVAEDPAQPSVDPTGTVDFIDTSNGNAVVCDNVALSGGEAECQTSTLTAGTHNIRADYSGDGNFDPSQSTVVEQVVIACAEDPIVTTNADAGAGSLREALAQVCTGDTITFDIAGAGPHTIALTTGELVVGKSVRVKNNSGESITVSGGGLSRVFNVNPGVTAALIGLTISGGDSATSGGGVLNDGTLTIVNSTLTGNSSDIDGGGISNSGSGVLTLINTTISGNSAAGNGGGVVNLGGTVTSVNSTITNNFADSDANSLGTGGGIHHGSGTTTLHNTIVAGNFNEDGPSDAADDISGTVNSASSFNLIGTGGAGGLTNGANNNQVGVADAGLGALADNGGTTQTHALSPTSAAVETGGNANLPADTFDVDNDTDLLETLPVDQRGVGFPRNADSQDANATQTVDIGAFELHPSVEDITDKSTPEDTLLSFSFNLGDGTGSLIASVTATSNNATLIPNANINITGSGSTRTIDITPALNANSPSDGTATITVTVTATNGRTAVDTFVVTVTEVNDNPVAQDDSLTAVDEDSGTRIIPFADLTGNDSPGPANESGQTLTVTQVNNPVGGTVVINGTNVEFTPTANFFGTASFDYTVTDNGTTNGVLDAKSDVGSASFTINPINDPPSFTIAADPPASNEDGGPQTVLNFATDISAGPNETGQILTFNITPNGSTGTLTFLTGPAIDATTGTLTYTANADTNGTATFDVTLSDNGSNTPPNSNTSAAQSFTITVNAQNDAPVVTTTAGNLSYDENDPPTAIDPGLTVTDGDSPNLVGATVAITAGFVSAEDVLGFTNQLGITGLYNNATGVLTLSGTASVADYQTALRSVTYQNLSDNPTSPRTVTFTANDGVSTGSASRGITINAENDAPENTVPGPQSTNQNTPLVFSGGNGNAVSVADVDAGSADIRVTLTVTNGTLTLGSIPAGLSFSDGDGTADTTMTFDGTLTEVNTAMNGMTFTPNMGFSGAATLTITSNDLGNTGSGGPLTDTDVVNIQVATNVSIHDAQVAEPDSGSVNMIFTVTLSAPAPAGGSSVDFTTVQLAPALNHATAGDDYTTTSGTVSFTAGEQFKTILVPVLSDNKNNEANETFEVLLSNPVNLTIADGTATGTIIENAQAGAVLISELRTSGPDGAGDDFVEIYNNSDSAHVVNGTGGGYGLFKMGATCSDTPVLIGVIPNGTTIPARGHFLFTGSAYSLADYGGSGAAAGDVTMSSDIENDRNVAIFATASLGEISSANRWDAVGFGPNVGGVCDLFREGNTLTPTVGSPFEYTYFRDECGKKGNPSTFGPCPTGGMTKDSNVNADDFIFADTTAANTPAGRRLGAPGPQNLGSPRQTLDIITLLLDSTKGASGTPNRVRDTSAIGPNAAAGTLSIRRRFQNNTGAPVTKLRIRVVDISTTFVSGGVADLRLLSSSNVTVSVNDSATCTAAGFASTPCNIVVVGTTLETPPAQPLGGGFNSSATTGTITLGTPLAPGASVNLQLLLGVQTTGSFKFFFNVEALP